MLLGALLFGGTGPPFGVKPVVPAALMVTEGLRAWSPDADAPFTMALLLTMVGGPTTGTAGVMGPLPFTGEMELLLPCCGAGPPTATGGAVLDAIAGDETGFLVALAYERAVG